uniref:Solute carrier family 3 member 2 N-terminal domain-containing protein n=1 Tax=Tetranychus urticae TaxID=32264 RepID=T1JZ46_TETUR
MKYANDPFWIKVRMLSFILFWIVWWATLAGSTVIIFYTPKCSIQSDVKESTGIITTTLAGVMDNSTNVPIVSTLASTITTAASTVALAYI